VRELSRRIAELPPERKKLFERLLEKGTAAAAPVDSRPADAEQVVMDNLLSFDELSTSGGSKAVYKRFYDSVSAQLNAAPAGQFSFFLNFGYVANGNPQDAAVALPAHCLNRNCTKLVLEVVGDCDLHGRDVLDVGCGRGGTVYTIGKYYDVRSITGLDLSSRAIAFCRRAHRDPKMQFLQGDAENLPFRAESFDVVTNLESSHSYPDIQSFYTEVFRVLRPGGCFLYTDLMSEAGAGEHLQFLRRLGFVSRRVRDITSNVLLSCEDVARVHEQTFDRRNDRATIGEFLAVPGSNVYNEMKSGAYTYQIWTLCKSERAAVA
jgi:phthiocerol/phenolphthiocerol synthesis type-I polyketide synthase E